MAMAAAQTVHQPTEPSPVSGGAPQSYSRGFRTLRVDSEPIVGSAVRVLEKALPVREAHKRSAPRERDSETEGEPSVRIAARSPPARGVQVATRPRSARSAGARHVSSHMHPTGGSKPQTTQKAVPSPDAESKEKNVLLSVAALLGEGRPASDPQLVDSAAVEDAAFCPAPSVLYDCPSTDAAPPPESAEGVDGMGNTRLPAANGSRMTALGGGNPRSSMPGMPPQNMTMLPPSGLAPPPQRMHVSANPAGRTAAQFLRDDFAPPAAMATDSTCFHCPHCSAAISAADIARSAAAQQNMRANIHASQQPPMMVPPMPPLQPDMVVGHPVAPTPTLPPFPPANRTATAPAAPMTTYVAHTDALEPVPDTLATAPSSAPDSSTREGKKLSKPRPRHIIHVGSELKDAVTRLTAMLPTSGPVAEILQPLLDNTYKSFESVYSARVTNEDYARAMNEAIRRLAATAEGRTRLAKIVQALRAHPELQKPKRPARTVYVPPEGIKCQATGETLPAPPIKFRNKRPDKNTGSTPVLGRDSEEPQLAFRREYGSRSAFMELAVIVLDDTSAMTTQPGQKVEANKDSTKSGRVTATVQEKNLVLWAGIVCLLDAALLQCTLAGDENARREVLKYFSDCVFPERLHYIFDLLHAPEPASG